MQTATNPQTGEKVQWNGSSWVPLGQAPAPQGPQPITVGTPRPPKPEKPEIRTVGNQIVSIGPDGSVAPIYQAPEKPTEADDKKVAKTSSLDALARQIQRVEDIYKDGFQNEAYGLFSSLAEYLPSDDASRLNSAGAGLAEQGLAAFRVPGVGSQSDTELRQFVEANRPSNTDRDVSIEEKLRQLKLRVDATREGMGLEPIQWDRPETVSLNAPAQDQLAASNNGYETIDDPALAGIRGGYLERLGSGQSPGEIMKWLEQAGVPMDGALRRSIVEQYNYRKKNPNAPMGNYDTGVLDDKIVPLSGAEQLLNDAAQSGLGAYAMRSANALTANNLDSVVGMTGGNAERTRLALDDAAAQNPGASLAGDLSGGIIGALGGEAALARLGMAGGVGRALVADTGYGAAAGAGGADDGSRLAGAGTGAIAGLVGSGLGQGLARGGSAIAGGVRDPSVNALLQLKTPVTLGQAVGRSGRFGEAIKGAEDRLAGIPGVGDMINARRTEGVRHMNTKAIDKALEPINGTVSGKIGEEGVAEARQKVAQAFNDALSGVSAQADNQFLGDTASALNRLRRYKRDGIGDEVIDQIEEATRGYFDPATGQITGENMQAFLESMRQIRAAYKNDPLGARIGKDVKAIETAVEGIFARQAPDVMPKFNAAKQAYRRVSIISDAVNRGKNTEGVFTPGQLGMADRVNASKFDGKQAAASGSGQFHDFQRNAQNVLPNQIPDSGTVGRLAVPLALGGAGAGLGAAGGDTQAGAQTGLGLAGFLMALYSKRGQSMLVAGATKRGPKARAMSDALRKRQRLIGAGGAAGALSATQSTGGQ